MDEITIIQPAGLGDILFTLKIGVKLAEQGHKIYWPVIPEYGFIKEYLPVPGIEWGAPTHKTNILDLQSAGKHFSGPFMDAKYKMANLSYHDWSKYVRKYLKRNKQNEMNLYMRVKCVANIDPCKEDFCLICDQFASPPHFYHRIIPPNGNLKNLTINPIDGITPLDWLYLIEQASELRFVDTCFTFLAEAFDLRAKSLNLYSRDGHFYTDHIWKKNWDYIR